MPEARASACALEELLLSLPSHFSFEGKTHTQVLVLLSLPLPQVHTQLAVPLLSACASLCLRFSEEICLVRRRCRESVNCSPLRLKAQNFKRQRQLCRLRPAYKEDHPEAHLGPFQGIHSVSVSVSRKARASAVLSPRGSCKPLTPSAEKHLPPQKPPFLPGQRQPANPAGAVTFLSLLSCYHVLFR